MSGTIAKIIDLLHEFQDLFPTKFSEMKGTLGDLGEMNILLNPDVKPEDGLPKYMVQRKSQP